MAEPDGTRSGLDYIVVPHVKQQPLYTVAARRPADNQSRHAALLRWSAGYNEDGTLRLAPDEAPKVIDNVDLERVLQGHTSDLFEYK